MQITLCLSEICINLSNLFFQIIRDLPETTAASLEEKPVSLAEVVMICTRFVIHNPVPSASAPAERIPLAPGA